jgi:hypothetical protein
MGALAGLLLLAALPSCGGPGTRLVTVRAGQPAGGAVELEVKNLTDVPINNFYLAMSGAVSPALDADAPDGQAVWGADLLTAALPRGEQVRVPVNEPGRWDARALDRDGRYQHIASLKLESGGRYILELQESGWRVR